MTLIYLLLCFSAILCAGLAVVAWRDRFSIPGVKSLVLLYSVLTVWCLGYVFEIIEPDLATKLLCAKLEYFGIALAPIAWLSFILRYAGHKNQPYWLRLIFWLGPISTLLLVWTNEFHGLIWSSYTLTHIGSATILSVTHGFWFWVHAFFSYITLIVSSILTIRLTNRFPRGRRPEGIALLFSALVPWIGNGLFLLGLSPVAWLDLTPFTFTLSSLALAWGVLNLRLVDIRPIALQETIRNMTDLMFVLDENGIITDLNPSACRACNLVLPIQPNVRLDHLLNLPSSLIENDRLSKKMVEGSPVIVKYQARDYEWSISPLFIHQHQPIGKLVIMHDITHHLQTERRLQSQFDVSHILENSSSLKDAGPQLIRLLCIQWGWDIGGIWETGLNQENLNLISLNGLMEIKAHHLQALSETVITSGSGFLGTVWAERKPLSYSLPLEQPASPVQNLLQELGCKNGIAIPINAGGELLGVIAFFGKASPPTQDLLDLLTAIASQIGQSIETSRAEIALKEREAFFHTLVEVIPQNLLCKDIAGNITFANDRYCATIGLPLKTILGNTHLNWYPEEKGRKYLDEDQYVLETGETIQFIDEEQLSSGEIKYNQVIKTPIRDRNGCITGLLLIFWDETKSIKTQNDLRESEAKYKSLSDHLPVGIYRTTQDGKILHVNSAIPALLGYDSVDQVIQNVNVIDLYPNPTVRNKQHEKWNLNHGLGSDILPIHTRDGRQIWLRDTGQVYLDDKGEIAYIDGILEDITDQKFAEDNLRESERRFRDLFEAADRQSQELRLLSEVRTALARQLDLEKIFQAIVNAIVKTFGYSLVSLYLLKEDVLVLQHQVGYDKVYDKIALAEGILGRAARTGSPILIQNTSQEPDFLEALPGITSEIAIPLFDQGKVVGVLNAESNQKKMLDENDLHIMAELGQYVSVAIERASLFTEAHDNEEKFRNVIEHSADGIVLANEQGEILEWNHGQERITGITKDEILGQKIWDVEFRLFLPEMQTPEIYQSRINILQKVMEPSKSYFQEEVIEYPIIRPDGQLRYLQVVLSPVKTENGTMLSSVTRDITENRMAEEALRRRDYILNAVAFAAAQFLKSPRWEDCIQTILERFATAIQVDRIVIYKNKVGKKRSLVSVRQFTWQNEIAELEQDKLFTTEINFPKNLPHHWADLLRAGQPIFGSLPSILKQEERTYLKWKGSAAVLPIFVGSEWWGFIVCVDPSENRLWTPDEIEGLKTAADILGTEIQRSETEKALRLSEEHNRAMLKAIPDLIYRFTITGTITASNNRDEGDSHEGMNISDVFSEELVDRAMHFSRLALETRETQFVEFEQPGPEGMQAFEARLVASGDQEVLAIVRNVTERARLEQMKSDFINRAAHDLRTPLTTATMMADLIYEGGDEDELAHFWQILRTELKRETNLIEELLNVGRLESGKYQIKKQSMNICASLISAVDGVRSLASSRSITLHQNIPLNLPEILADPVSLQQVFMNLLVNSVKFTPADGQIFLDAHENGSGVEVFVRDTGIGIPAKDLPNLFQRFFRASNAIEEEIQGTGVGLFIVKSIIEQHKGKISVDSRPGEGTMMTVWLPYARSTGQELSIETA